MGFAKLLIGWSLSMAIYTVIVMAWHSAKGQARSGFIEALLGLGILLAIPSFLFALIVGWPIMSWLAGLRPVWLVPPVAGAVFALLTWVLTAFMLPEGWRGAGDVLVGYAAVLGLVWGCLNLTAAPAG